MKVLDSPSQDNDYTYMVLTDDDSIIMELLEEDYYDMVESIQ